MPAHGHALKYSQDCKAPATAGCCCPQPNPDVDEHYLHLPGMGKGRQLLCKFPRTGAPLGQCGQWARARAAAKELGSTRLAGGNDKQGMVSILHT